ELAVEEAVEGEDVVVALMVGQDDVGLLRPGVLAPLDAYPDRAQPGETPGPDRAALEGGALADRRDQNGGDAPARRGAQHGRIEDEERPGNEQPAQWIAPCAAPLHLIDLHAGSSSGRAF